MVQVWNICYLGNLEQHINLDSGRPTNAVGPRSLLIWGISPTPPRRNSRCLGSHPIHRRFASGHALPKLAHGDPSQGPLTAGGSPGARTLRAPESKMHGRSCTKGLTGSCFRHDVVFGALCVSGAFRSFRFSWLCWCDVSFRILRVMVYPPNIDGFWFRAWH